MSPLAIPEREAGSELDRCRDLIASRRLHGRVWAKRNVFGLSEPVTGADVAIQEILTGLCARSLPGVPVIGEEGQIHRPHIPGTCVLIDPIDGTGPLLRGEHDFSISLCVVDAGRPCEALVDLPGYGVRVTARAGQGVRVEGMLCGLPDLGPDTLLASPGQARRVSDAVRRTPGTSHLLVRPVPTTSVKIVLAALGRAGAAIRVEDPVTGVAPWDYAAASLIMSEAGGAVTDECGGDLGGIPPRFVTAWLACRGPRLCGPLRALLGAARPPVPPGGVA